MTVLMILFAKYLYLLVIFLAVVFIFLQKRAIQKSILLLSIVSLPISYSIAFIAGKLFYDPRPFAAHHFKPLISHAPTNGFPSDHALLCFTIAAIIFAFHKRLGIALGILGLLVGVARMYVGVHSLVDILGSLVIGVGVVCIVKRFIRTEVSPVYK